MIDWVGLGYALLEIALSGLVIGLKFTSAIRNQSLENEFDAFFGIALSGGIGNAFSSLARKKEMAKPLKVLIGSLRLYPGLQGR